GVCSSSIGRKALGAATSREPAYAEYRQVRPCSEAPGAKLHWEAWIILPCPTPGLKVGRAGGAEGPAPLQRRPGALRFRYFPTAWSSRARLSYSVPESPERR